MNYSLENLTILVTRPLPAGKILCEKIHAAGGHAIYLPTIEIVSLIHEAKEKIYQLDHYDWVIFTSPQAVYCSRDLVHTTFEDLPPHVKFAAVGGSTAAALFAASFPEVLYPKTEWSSEGLLALPELQHVNGKKILLVHGAGGRDLLENEFIQRGASVEHAIVYRRQSSAVDISLCTELLIQHKIDIITITSKDNLIHFKKLLEKYWYLLQEIPVIVISERLKQAAHAAGFKKIYLVKNGRDETLLEFLSNHKESFMPATEIEKITKKPKKVGSFWGNVGILITTLAIVVLLAASALTAYQFVVINKQFASLLTEVSSALHKQQNEIEDLQKSVVDLQQITQKVIVEKELPANLTETYSSLMSLDNEIDKLPVRLKTISTVPVESLSTIAMPWWKRGLHQAWESLQKIIVVRHAQTSVPPFIAPEQKEFLYQNIHAALQNAVWALLHQKPEIYQNSLQRIDQWTKQYFVLDAPETKTFLAHVQQLQAFDFSAAKK